MSQRLLKTVACLAVIAVARDSGAAEDRFQAGLVAGVSVADGEPANDIPGFGVQFRYALSDQWSIGGMLAHTEYDFETPASIVGIVQDPSVEPVDALATATSIARLGGANFQSGQRRNHLVRGIRTRRRIRGCSGRERADRKWRPVRHPYRSGHGSPADGSRRRAAHPRQERGTRNFACTRPSISRIGRSKIASAAPAAPSTTIFHSAGNWRSVFDGSAATRTTRCQAMATARARIDPPPRRTHREFRCLRLRRQRSIDWAGW